MDHVQQLPYSNDTGLGQTAKIGLIVLQTDQTLEDEFRQMLAINGVACYHSRIVNAMHVTPQTLAQMQTDLPIAARLLPQALPLMPLVMAAHRAPPLLVKRRWRN